MSWFINDSLSSKYFPLTLSGTRSHGSLFPDSFGQVRTYMAANLYVTICKILQHTKYGICYSFSCIPNSSSGEGE